MKKNQQRVRKNGKLDFQNLSRIFRMEIKSGPVNDQEGNNKVRAVQEGGILPVYIVFLSGVF